MLTGQAMDYGRPTVGQTWIFKLCLAVLVLSFKGKINCFLSRFYFSSYSMTLDSLAQQILNPWLVTLPPPKFLSYTL